MTRRLPLPLVLAALAPTLLVGVLEVARELGAPLPFSLWTVALLWLFTTIPLVLLVLGLRALQPPAPSAVTDETRGAFEAVARAERAIMAAASTLQSAQDAFLRVSEGRAGEMRPRSRAPLWAALGLAFVLASGGLAYAVQQSDPLPIHWHAGFAIFVDGERLAFLDPAFDVTQRNVIRGHVHVTDTPPGLLHLEGEEGDAFPLAQALRDAISVNITDDAMVLDGIVHQNATYQAEGERKLHLFVAHDAGATWEPMWPIANYKVKDRDRVLLTFGAPTAAEVERQAATVPWRFP